MKNKQKISAMVLGLCALLMIGSVYVWAVPCTGMLTTADGNMVYMKCHYLAACGGLTALMCVAFAIHIAWKKEIPSIPIIVLGIISVLITVSCSMGIGVCQASGMACHGTALWFRAIGVILVLCGIYSLVDFDKQL